MLHLVDATGGAGHCATKKMPAKMTVAKVKLLARRLLRLPKGDDVVLVAMPPDAPGPSRAEPAADGSSPEEGAANDWVENETIVRWAEDVAFLASTHGCVCVCVPAPMPPPTCPQRAERLIRLPPSPFMSLSSWMMTCEPSASTTCAPTRPSKSDLRAEPRSGSETERTGEPAGSKRGGEKASCASEVWPSRVHSRSVVAAAV